MQKKVCLVIFAKKLHMLFMFSGFSVGLYLHINIYNDYFI